MKKIKNGCNWEYDVATDTYQNPKTLKWVSNPRPPSQKKKIISKRRVMHWNSVRDIISGLSSDKYQEERYYNFLTKIYQATGLFRNNDEEDARVAYYDSDNLKLILGTANYKKAFIEPLMDAGVIVSKEISISSWGHPILAYRITEDFMPEKFKMVNIKYKATELSMIRYYKRKKAGLDTLEYAIFKRVRKYRFDLTSLTKEVYNGLMMDKYLTYIEKFEQKKQHIKRYKNKTPLTVDEYIKRQSIYFNQMSSWNRKKDSNDRIDYFSHDDFGNRFFSIFTSIPSELRKYVTTESGAKPFSRELDLVTSQFVIAANYVKGQIDGTCKFIEDVESGHFYEKIMETYGITDRQVAKQFSLQFLFGDIEGSSHKDFEAKYPVAGRIFRELKSKGYTYTRYKNGRKSERKVKRNAALARLIQQSESSMFREIWGLLLRGVKDENKEYKAIHFLPVHDAIYVKESDYDNAMAGFHSVCSNTLSVKFKVGE